MAIQRAMAPRFEHEQFRRSIVCFFLLSEPDS